MPLHKDVDYFLLKNRKTPMISKETKTVVIGFSLPLILIVVVGCLVGIQDWKIKPNHDFLFSLGQYYNNDFRYTTENGYLEKVEEKPDTTQRHMGDYPRLFIYEVKTGKSRELRFDEAQQLSLDTKLESPDGYSVGGEHSSVGERMLFIYSNSSSGIYIRKDAGRKKIDLPALGTGSYWQGQFVFLGWVVKD
jgi:hypothetical protein